MIIEGRPVLDLEPEFSTSPRAVAKRALSLTALGFARQYAAFPGLRAAHVLSHRFLLTSKAEIETLTQFHDQMAGKHGDFWVPSWHGEVHPVADLLIAGTALSITPVGYNATYLNDADTTRLGRYLWLVRRDGVTHVSAVSSCADGNPEILTLADAPAADFTVGNFIAGFLYLARFMDDSLALDFEGPLEASTTLSFIEVLQQAGSADA